MSPSCLSRETDHIVLDADCLSVLSVVGWCWRLLLEDYHLSEGGGKCQPRTVAPPSMDATGQPVDHQEIHRRNDTPQTEQ